MEEVNFQIQTISNNGIAEEYLNLLLITQITILEYFLCTRPCDKLHNGTTMKTHLGGCSR